MGGLVIANIAVNEGLAADHAIIANADAVPDTRSNADMAAGAQPDSAAGRHSGTRRRIVSEHIIRSEEHTSELQSLMRISYAVFCLKTKTKKITLTKKHKTYSQ